MDLAPRARDPTPRSPMSPMCVPSHETQHSPRIQIINLRRAQRDLLPLLPVLHLQLQRLNLLLQLLHRLLDLDDGFFGLLLALCGGLSFLFPFSLRAVGGVLLVGLSRLSL